VIYIWVLFGRPAGARRAPKPASLGLSPEWVQPGLAKAGVGLGPWTSFSFIADQLTCYVGQHTQRIRGALVLDQILILMRTSEVLTFNLRRFLRSASLC